jgi:predicted nuclease with TOPRIM domain
MKSSIDRYTFRHIPGEWCRAPEVVMLIEVKDAEIERLKKALLAPIFQDKQRISTLEAEIELLTVVWKSRGISIDYCYQRIAQLEAENAKLGQALAQLNSAPVEELKRIEELEAENARLKEVAHQDQDTIMDLNLIISGLKSGQLPKSFIDNFGKETI